jgi:hypothetical protein
MSAQLESAGSARDANGGTASGDPVLAALDRIEARLARVEAAIARADALAGQTPALVAAAVDTFDDVEQRLRERGVDVDERLRRALSAIEKLTEPAALRAVESLAELAVKMPGAVAAAVDTFDHWAAARDSAGVDLDERVRSVMGVLERATSPGSIELLSALIDRVEVVRHLLESGVFDGATVDVVASVAETVTACATERPRPIGAFGLLRSLRDPDVQRALGFAMTIAGAVGRTMGEPSPSRRLLEKGRA